MPVNPLHVLRVNARELLRTPGSMHAITVDLAATDLGEHDDRITGLIEKFQCSSNGRIGRIDEDDLGRPPAAVGKVGKEQRIR